MTNCVVDRAESEFKNYSQCVFKPEGDQFLAPIFDDVRLLQGSIAETAGRAEHLERLV